MVSEVLRGGIKASQGGEFDHLKPQGPRTMTPGSPQDPTLFPFSGQGVWEALQASSNQKNTRVTAFQYRFYLNLEGLIFHNYKVSEKFNFFFLGPIYSFT